jgi:hypothetical protein
MKDIFFICFLSLLPLAGYNQSITKYNPQELYEQQGGLFDIDSIRTISIEFYNSNYHKILTDNWFANNNERLPATIEFGNEIKLDSVAIRYKGNSTFYIPHSFGFLKLPWNIDINEYVSGQKLKGSKKLKLANTMFDPTFVKEILGYSIYQKYLPAPEANYMRVEVQGDYMGLYLNTEPVDKLFLKKHFDENDGVLFKCDPIQRYGQPGPSGTSDLKWLGADSTLYYNHYELKSKYGWKEFIHMIDVLNNNPQQIDSVLNVDRILWAFAVNQAISNFDTYNGIDPRNYYMYQTKDGLFQMIPWDVSESFINAMLGDADSPNDFYQYDPYKGAKCWWYPLNATLIGDATSKYGKIYTAHLRTILEESLQETEILNDINDLQSIAEEAVENAPNNVWNMSLFRSNVHTDFSAFGYSFAGIMRTIDKRNAFLKQHPELLKEPPVISEVDVHEKNNTWFVNVRVSNVALVELMVCSNSFNSKFKSIGMNDYGLNGDILADDGIFTAPVPENGSSTDTKFYIRASNNKAIQLSPQRAEYEFYMLSSPNNQGTINDTREISLFPNPTQGIFCLKGDFFPITTYEVLSTLGQKVMTGALSSHYNWIDLTPHSQGVYFVKVGSKTYKILKTD